MQITWPGIEPTLPHVLKNWLTKVAEIAEDVGDVIIDDQRQRYRIAIKGTKISCTVGVFLKIFVHFVFKCY